MNHETARAIEPKSAGISVTSLPFERLPGSSRLFLDYLASPAGLSRYYPNAVDRPLDVAGHADAVLAAYRTERNALCTALDSLNARFDAPSEVLSNVERLRSSNCVAVVTGQQAGLFTGPLYTIYKALSAIRCAEDLTRQGVNAVPVFWIASEDHDFDEVSHTFVNGSAGTQRISFQPQNAEGGLPVGRIHIDANIQGSIHSLAAILDRTEFTAEVVEGLKNDWEDGSGYAEAFGRSITRLLGKLGLILVDPLDSEIKSLCSPVYSAAISRADEIVTAIRERSALLDSEGYHAQVLVEEDYFPLFWHDDQGRRRALRKVRNGLYRAKGQKQEFSTPELARLAAAEPQRFSPGVMVRPVVQDYLLPTICYFGGAAEIAYFAQNSEAYRLLERRVTPIFHRQSSTVVEARQQRTMERLKLELTDLFRGEETLRLDAAKTEFWADTGRLFSDVEERVNTELHRLDQRLSEIDVTIANNLATRRRKILYHIAALKKKTLLAQARNNDVLGRRFDDLFAALLPGGVLQERVLNVHSFLNRYGDVFIDRLYDLIDLGDKGHRVIHLS